MLFREAALLKSKNTFDTDSYMLDVRMGKTLKTLRLPNRTSTIQKQSPLICVNLFLLTWLDLIFD